ncbi:DUF930 domain-containing protein [Neorhizobium lilium]|uniref:DUF930 domain-containing protein n=1 Tax=Neorhizobium lilium TaxID=2503024 RepID=A0A3S3VKA2_9HYPH|nr:DUF930 domain-containing protein [Neorhizobium lilium]RWX78581.1 DUF930 domain-containing protein [Neorhizobium lilium]
MSEDRRHSYGKIGWGVGVSVLLHMLVVAAFLVRLPLPVSEPPKEETVEVELVPPPQPQPEPKEPETPKLKLPKPEEPKPEEAKKEEPPPPPPEAPKVEEAQKQEPPPPPPKPPEPPKQEAKQPEPPPPRPAKQEEPAADQAQQGKPQPLDVLRPVVEFGDKDSGPRKALDGNSSAEQGPQPDQAPTEEKADAAAADAPPPPDKAEETQGNPVPDISVPEISASSANPQAQGNAGVALPDEVKAALVTPAPKPDVKPSTKPKPVTTADLPEVKRLFSTNDTGEGVARTAMGNIPRDIRASQLCSTELKEQLRHGSPSYSPELLPSYRLPSGTVMEVQRGAFRADAQWYDLSFRCELDDKVTKVVSFGFTVGPPVPQSQWRKRGFPEF